jgi:GNAT superfamily N-acetyltransferase
LAVPAGFDNLHSRPPQVSSVNLPVMPDLLVNLLKLPRLQPLVDQSHQNGAVIRRAQPFELTPVRQFIEKNFSLAWADEVSVGFANKPVTVYIATRDSRVVGFAGYECTRKAFFGPTGVAENERGQGIGKALLVASLWGLRELDYVYGIIGGAGPVEFYQAAVGAIVLPDSEPGIYTDLLKKQ